MRVTARVAVSQRRTFGLKFRVLSDELAGALRVVLPRLAFAEGRGLGLAVLFGVLLGEEVAAVFLEICDGDGGFTLEIFAFRAEVAFSTLEEARCELRSGKALEFDEPTIVKTPTCQGCAISMLQSVFQGFTYVFRKV